MTSSHDQPSPYPMHATKNTTCLTLPITYLVTPGPFAPVVNISKKHAVETLGTVFPSTTLVSSTVTFDLGFRMKVFRCSGTLRSASCSEAYGMTCVSNHLEFSLCRNECIDV